MSEQMPDDGGESKLPLRWFAILAVAAAIGFVVYAAAGPGYAAVATITATGVMHTIIK